MITGKKVECDFCQGYKVEGVYRPADSMREAEVSVCHDCGLVQTVYGLNQYERHAGSISSGAGWGNIRHGKQLRLDVNMHLIEKYISTEPGCVLDIGANRGDFINWVNKYRPGVHVDAIEPDISLHHLYESNTNVKIIGNRIEDVDLKPGGYDFALCLHSLEHAASALGMLSQARNSLRPGGHLLLELPDLEQINDVFIVEEFFIDKHSFHLDDFTLRRCFSYLGLKVVDQLVPDGRNLNYILEVVAPSDMLLDNAVAQMNILSIKRFANNLESNRSKLSAIAHQISTLAQRQKVGIWGGGRIFDALVRFGGLDINGLLVIDDYLAGKIESVHGVSIRKSTTLRIEKPQVLFVLAKGSAKQIEKLARSYGVRNIVTFDDMFSRLR